MSDKLIEEIKKKVSDIQDEISQGNLGSRGVFTAMRTAYMPAMSSLESNSQAVRELVEALQERMSYRSNPEMDDEHSALIAKYGEQK